MVAQFIAEEGSVKGLVLALAEGDEWAIGRDIDQCDLIIEDLTVSRRHLLCRKTKEGYVIENVSETQPVLVNEEPLEGTYLLHENDLVRIGNSLFRFYTKEPQEEKILEDVAVGDETELKYDTIYEE